VNFLLVLVEHFSPDVAAEAAAIRANVD